MIARLCGCWGNYGCRVHGGYSTVTIPITADVTGNQISTSAFTSARPARSAPELETIRKLVKQKRAVVEVDEKRLIAAPTRQHAKSHQSQSSRAAMSVRQFASRVK